MSQEVARDPSRTLEPIFILIYGKIHVLQWYLVCFEILYQFPVFYPLRDQLGTLGALTIKKWDKFHDYDMIFFYIIKTKMKKKKHFSDWFDISHAIL